MSHSIYRALVGTTRTQVLAPRDQWREVSIASVNGLGIIYVGFDTNLTANNGYPLPSNQGAVQLFLAPGYAIYAIGTAATDEIAVFETSGSPNLLFLQKMTEKELR